MVLSIASSYDILVVIALAIRIDGGRLIVFSGEAMETLEQIIVLEN